MIAKRENNKIEPDISNFNEIKRGLQSFRSYTIKKVFRIEDAILASAKFSLMASMILTNSTNIEYISGKNNIEIIENIEYNYLNKLLKTNKLAFLYFNKSLKLLHKI